MTVSTVSKVLEQRLFRGSRVVVADSYKNRKLRGKTLVVTSKSTVVCNGNGRCAGDGSWCPGKAVFVSTEASAKRDKKMGWRSGTEKICLTHLKDEDGDLFVPPSFSSQGFPALANARRMADALSPDAEAQVASAEVSWEALAHAHRSGNIDQLATLARSLKVHVEELKTRVIHLQDEMLEKLIREE